MVQGWGLDLSLFQFDYEQTWSAMMTNGDKSIYGRYGSRSGKDSASGQHISIEGFKKALEGVLALHAGYPGNKKELEGKTGPPPKWRTPEAIPDVAAKPWNKPADGGNNNCLHCHETHQGEMATLRMARQPIPEKLLRAYPMPNDAGFSLDPRERATVTRVEAGTPGERAGLKPGDRIARLEGQPIVSIADVQWVLHHAKDPGTVKAELDRGGQKAEATIALPAGWRAKVDYTWRGFTYYLLRYKLLGTMPLEPLPDGERQKLGIAGASMALRIKQFAPDWGTPNPAAKRSFQAGDVIVEADGRRDLASEGDFLAYLLQKKAPGQTVNLTVMRSGKSQRVVLPLP